MALNSPGPRRHEQGFSLVEMLIVVAIVGLISAFAFSHLGARRDAAGGGTRALAAVASRLQERQEAARRLRPMRGDATTLEAFSMPPLEIDFATPSTTRELVTDGVDADGNGTDDNTGATITRAVAPASGFPDPGTWQYGYQGSPVSLPTGWRVATSAEQLNGIPLIANGQGGRGVLATRFGFDARGKASAAAPGVAALSTPPPGAPSGEGGVTTAPFWALYLAGPSGAAAAVAVHPTGALEVWHWDGSSWQGFDRRTLN